MCGVSVNTESTDTFVTDTDAQCTPMTPAPLKHWNTESTDTDPLKHWWLSVTGALKHWKHWHRSTEALMTQRHWSTESTQSTDTDPLKHWRHQGTDLYWHKYVWYVSKSRCTDVVSASVGRCQCFQCFSAPVMLSHQCFSRSVSVLSVFQCFSGAGVTSAPVTSVSVRSVFSKLTPHIPSYI